MELKSNEYFSIKELLSTENRKLIIPDFQRDYCWGDKTHGVENNTDIVSGFLDTLFEEFTNDTGDVLIGKIDVYESPKNHIYLTDGQQRLTTLYLIIGMLYRKVQDGEIKDKLKACLISDFEEKQDDIEPYLQYAVRESTVFFIRDLVNEYFSKENTLKVSDIQNQPWYFSEYDLDPSIISVLNALEIIENKLNINKDIKIENFSEFVINNIKIQYYVVEDKKHGEERFVIINTTGKSLTVSENIKPLLLGKFENKNFADQWEERESWFWKNRDKQKENISDNGVNQFLVWCFQIIDQQDDVDIIKKAKALLKDENSQSYLDKIQSIYEALKLLIEYLNDERFQKQFKFINDNKEIKSIVDVRSLSKIQQQNIVLPLLSFVSKFGNKKDECYQFLRRLRKNYFDQKWNERNCNYLDWRYVLQIIEKSDVGTILGFDNKNFDSIKNIALPMSMWFNDEEKQKDQLSEYKTLLEKWEDYPDFMGDLSPLFKMTENSNDVEILEKYFDTYKNIQIDDFNFTDDINIINVYRLYHYVRYGVFEHRSVAGYGYCMLVKSNVKLFLLDGFDEIWENFYQGFELSNFFYEKIKILFNDVIVKDLDLNNILDNTTLINHYERVKLWSYIEFLYTKNKIDFNNNICIFWDNTKNLLVIEDEIEKNNNSIGNLLLGTSYANNKSGCIYFTDYPLMKLISQNREEFIKEINSRTIELKNKLIEFTS